MVDKKITELQDYTPPIDTDLMPVVDITTATTKRITWANIKAALKTYFDTLYMALTGNQTIAGVKTFSSIPVLPASVILTTPVINTSVSGTAGFLKSKIILATRDMTAASGDVAYTGLDFTPTSIIALYGVIGMLRFGVGISDAGKGISSLSIFNSSYINVPTWYFIELTDGTNGQNAIIKTYDANVGFTLTWGKTGSPTGTLSLVFLCFR